MPRYVLCMCALAYALCSWTPRAQSELTQVFPEFEHAHKLLVYEAPDVYYMTSWEPFKGLALVRSLDGALRGRRSPRGLGETRAPSVNRARGHTPSPARIPTSFTEPRAGWSRARMVGRRG